MNIYLITAESYRLIANEVQKIVKNKNYLTMNLNRVTLEDVFKEANYYGLGDTEKIIVVSNAYLFGSNKINEKDVDILLNYLNNPNSRTTIIFTTLETIDLRKKQTKLIKEKFHLINILPLSWKDKENEIQKYVNNAGYIIDNNSINYIINNTTSLDQIFNELDKIFLYYNKAGKIDYKDITKIVGSIIDNNNFHFVSAVVDRNLNIAMKLFYNLKVYKVEPVTLIVLLAREYRNMYYLKEYQKQKLDIKEISKNMALQDWQINKLYTSSLKYQEAEILDIIKKLANIDIGIKTGKYDKDAALMTFLVEICA